MTQVTNGGTILPNSFGEFIASNYNHVTVVQVEESERKNPFDDDFVTVLQIGEPEGKADKSADIEEELVIYRLPGERLGMALKFDGGMNPNEKINKVFLQSINKESPASKVCGQVLEFLQEGDEIMSIDGQPTTSMTRLECIGILRDAPVCIKIRVRRESACHDMDSSADTSIHSILDTGSNASEMDNNSLSKVNGWSKKVPPPVPPRMATTILSSKRKSANNCRNRSDSDCDSIEKPPRKKTSQPPPLPPRRPKVPPPEPPSAKNIGLEENCKNELNINAIESDAMKTETNVQSLEEVIETKLGQEKQNDDNRGLEPTLPSEPDIYIDLLADEDRDEDRLLIESESDDTGSSVSTVIERFSRTSTANSSFSDHNNCNTPTIDIVGRVLSPFEKLERELDHKEALQAFVNKAAAVLMADEDLRQITDESLCNENYNQMDVNKRTEIQTSDQILCNNKNQNVNEVLPNNPIIGPPEEFATNLKESLELSKNQLTEESVNEMSIEEELESVLSHNSNEEINSIENEIEIIDQILNEVINDTNSHQNMICETETRDLLQTNGVDIDCNQSTVVSNECLSEEQINCLKSEELEPIKCENNIENQIKSNENSLESIPNDNKNENFKSNNELDLFEDIDDLNREIEALEELIEYEMKMESNKECPNNSEMIENIDSNEDKQQIETNLDKKVIENSMQTKTNGNKYSPPMSLIPRRLPISTPRKSKSYGNLPSLYANNKTPDLKPSLIPRPVLKISSVMNSRNDSSVKQICSKNSNKVQNSKSVQKSKTRILSERKKNEILNSNSNENKRTVNQKALKSVLKCKSLMDLTTDFNSADIRNGANDSEEAIQSTECVLSRPQIQCNPLLIESNQTKSSLESRPEDEGTGGTESESQLNWTENIQQKPIIENSQTFIIVDKTSCHSRHNYSIEDNLLKSTQEECSHEIKTFNSKEDKPLNSTVDPEEEPLNEKEMFRLRNSHHLMEMSMDSTCLPPTYARQPPDGREITLNYMDGNNSSISAIPSLSCEMFQMTSSVHEDSGVFIDNDTPSPDLDLNRGVVHNIAVHRIKYKSIVDNSSDADTGITSMSSDSMDELDSCPISNYKLKKHLMDRNFNPSSDFLSETATNGFTVNGINSNKSSDLSKSVRERIAMFDNQRSNSLESNDSIKSMTSKSIQSVFSAKNELMSENNCDHNSDKSQNVFNTKNSFIHRKSSSLSLTTDNIQKPPTNPTAPQYSGHLQPSYLRYSSLGSTNDTALHSSSNTGIGVHKPLLNGSTLLSSILETRKQNASKLKGLIIPDIPTTTQPAVSKTLPTILSNTSTSSLVLTSKPEEVSVLTQRSHTQSQPNIPSNYNSIQRHPLLSEPPWASNNGSMPKYSPAFKRRQLELPRSLSLLNNAQQDSTDPINPSFNRCNSMTTMSANDTQFQFSLSHSKPVIPLMPETAIGSPIDGLNGTNMPSLEEQLAVGLNDPFRHSSVQRRYSADVFNANNSSKFSLEKRSSDSTNGLFKGSLNSMIQNDITSNTSHRSPVISNKMFDSMIKPIISERKCIQTNGKVFESDFQTNRNIFGYNSNNLSQIQLLNSKNKCEDNYHNKTLPRSVNSDYSDDDSSTISQKTSEDSIRADDSASDTASDSLDHTFSPELTRPKVLGTQLTVLKNPMETEKTSIKDDNNSDSIKHFRALAEQWEQRSGSENYSQNSHKNISPPLPPKPSVSLARIPPSLMPRTKKITQNTENLSIDPTFCHKFPTEIKQLENIVKELEINSDFETPKTSIDVRSDSLSSESGCDSDQPVKNVGESETSRSVSDICKVFETSGTDTPSAIATNKSASEGNPVIRITDKTDEEDETQEVETNSKKDNSSKNSDENEVELRTKKSKYSEEKVWDKSRDNEESVLSIHQRMSSMDSLASDSGASSLGTAVRSLGQRTSSATNLRDSLYGSVSSLASSTSIICPHELQQLIDEANQSLETNDLNNHNIQVVVLHREYKTSGSIGVILAGGSDCETKEFTVHRVINGSLCDRDGRIKKGDRILSINGKILKAVTHKEALDIMKSPRPEVVIVLSRVCDNGFHSRQSSNDLNDSTNGNTNSYHSYNEDILSSVQLSPNKESENNLDPNYRILRAELQKDVAGLGFILEGGKDSPLGDRPLAIKRIFRGGPADKEGTLASGDEVISVNDHSVANMTRTEAWNFLKKLPEGHVILVIKRKKY